MQMDSLANMIAINHKSVDQVWVGLSDEREAGMWAWTDTSPFNYRPWKAETQQSGKNCAMLTRETGFLKLIPARCSLPKPYVCVGNLS
ncbi:regenerating islet-derived protein 3-gamma-like [Hemicordylus capensis]|uniref:regenerating islet-derived protein 3-gamma-like n=1 Tax=Hemicordylus capensis TaxID=884348 RepID=UPI0023041711|nr:regenerating islet-derived protein 3-gamma-like [Hemicordylus capensis]